MLEMEYFGFFWVNTMAADALAPKVARASAGKVSAVQHQQTACIVVLLVYFIHIGQAKSKIKIKMVNISLIIFQKQFSMLRVLI